MKHVFAFIYIIIHRKFKLVADLRPFLVGDSSVSSYTTRKTPISDTQKYRFSSQTAIYDVGCYENPPSLLEHHKRD
jgi:hypothetical protein